MQRIKNLENSIYREKYKEIYKLIFTADIDNISDYSDWMYKGNKNYVEINRPLWIVMESKIINKRIWISHEFGKLSLTTAQLNLDIDSKEYHDSYEWYSFTNQIELCNKLEELLKPCLEKSLQEDLEIDR